MCVGYLQQATHTPTSTGLVATRWTCASPKQCYCILQPPLQLYRQHWSLPSLCRQCIVILTRDGEDGPIRSSKLSNHPNLGICRKPPAAPPSAVRHQLPHHQPLRLSRLPRRATTLSFRNPATLSTLPAAAMLRSSIVRASRSSIVPTARQAVRVAPAACQQQQIRQAHAISNPTLANIEKRWDDMPPQEQADLWMSLRDRMKVDWKEMTMQEKKAGA